MTGKDFIQAFCKALNLPSEHVQFIQVTALATDAEPTITVQFRADILANALPVMTAQPEPPAEPPDEIEALAALPVAELDLRIRMLNKVIQQAQADGDERWKTTAKPQAETLNAARALAMKRHRVAQGIAEPESSVIDVALGTMAAKTQRLN